jgi:MurNAc alpha-1-phosphate uridylyltransferase
MILAAGRGERLRPVTDTTPKALVEVKGTSLLERHLRAIKASGIDTVVINLGWLGEKIVDRIGSGSRYGLDVVYSPEDDNVLETGGGILRALPMLGDGPFLVINADICTEMTLPVDALLATDLAHLVLVPKPEHFKKGDFELDDGRVRNATKPRLTFSGVALYRPAFFARCTPGRFSLAPMLHAAADIDRLSGSLYRGFWTDVGTPGRLAELNADISRRR